MPDSKITALTSIGASTDPANDPLVLVDVSDTSMAATGTTKKVTLNQLLGASGTATLASATITGDLTVDTSTLKVDSANNRVGIGTASPSTTAHIVGGNANTLLLDNGGQQYTQFILQRNGTANTGGDILVDGTAAIIAYRGLLVGDLVFQTSTSAGSPGERYRIASDGVATWSNVGGVAGTAMTLNSTGLGVGVAPTQPLTVRSSVAAIGMFHSTNASGPYVIFQNSTGNFGDIGSELAITGGGSAGNLTLNSRSTSNLCFAVSDSVKMRIDSSGNVGIGVTPKSWLSSYKAIQLGYSTSLSSTTGTDFAGLSSNAYVDSVDSRWERIVSGYATQYYQNAGDGQHIWRIAGTAAADTAITWTNAMTLDASGNLLVGATTNGGNGVSIRPSTASPNVVLVGSDTSGGTAWQLYSTGTSSNRFYVTWAGVVNAVNTTISGISDARLKENVQDIDVGLGAILALKPRKFDWKAGKGKDIKGDRGFIAQEFEQVFPQLVDEWADPAPEGEAPYKSVRQDLIPVLVKAIQELTARVQTLETR